MFSLKRSCKDGHEQIWYLTNNCPVCEVAEWMRQKTEEIAELVKSAHPLIEHFTAEKKAEAPPPETKPYAGKGKVLVFPKAKDVEVVLGDGA